MYDLDEIKKKYDEQNKSLRSIGDSICITKISDELKTLEQKTQKPDFWNNSSSDENKEILSKISEIKKKVLDYDSIEKILNNIKDGISLLELEQDETLAREVIKLEKEADKSLENLEIKSLFFEKYDKNNAIVTIHPGAGGTESMDWASMLYRMYVRWCQDNGFNLEELDELDGEEAGIKSVTFLVSGEYAYGYLKSENGVHRLIRISPFDSGGRRHTSFASVEVIPEINDDEKIEINPDDIKMDVYRASGAGGQHINKTSSAVRLTHIPTGIVVSCQTQRSQFQNRETAMKMLMSKLVNLKEKAHKDKIEDLKGVQKDIAWGSQIRSYVFCPYTMVKDHRTNEETSDVQGVMDGDINRFIFAYLRQNSINNIK